MTEPDRITVELSYRDCQLVVLALADLETATGEPAWTHPAVTNLRHKIAAAIAERLGLE